MSTSAITKEKLISDIKVVIHDCEEILKATANQAGEKVAEVRARAEKSLREARVRLSELENIAVQKGKEAARVADQYVHDNPWQAVGIAAAVGFLIGLAIRRR